MKVNESMKEYISIDDVMSVFNDYMCNDIDEDGTEIFLEMLKDKVESEDNMTRTLTITYEKSNENIPVMCVSESNLFSITVLKIFTGKKAEDLFVTLSGQNVITKAESEA